MREITTRDVLVAARARVARGWTQGCSARDSRGEPIAPDDGRAQSWCAAGAIYAVEPLDVIARAVAYHEIKRYIPYDAHISDWNDTPGRTQAEVLAAFDRAIAAQDAPETLEG